MFQGVTSFTPNPSVYSTDTASQLEDVIALVSQRVTRDVIAHLSPSVQLGTSPNTAAASPSPTVSTPKSHDISQIQFLHPRKLKDPPSFRGDCSDSVSVGEWEDLMRNYIKRGNLRPEEQAEEILVHLRGKARDVVRFGTRNSNIDVSRNPEAIYGLLRKHFDTVPSSPLPLADFYTTLPEKDEDAFDYWLRLNRAVDLAVERLREQGKTLDYPGTEVARMFIRNCPSKELALTFRTKTVDKWSAHEVQDILNAIFS